MLLNKLLKLHPPPSTLSDSGSGEQAYQVEGGETSLGSGSEAELQEIYEIQKKAKKETVSRLQGVQEEGEGNQKSATTIHAGGGHSTHRRRPIPGLTGNSGCIVENTTL